VSKTGLVMSGGGAKCAWEIGALSFILKAGLMPEGFKVIAGTSGGALNAICLAQAPAKKWGDALLKAETLWKSIKKRSDVVDYRFPRFLAAIFGKSLYTNSKLRQLLRQAVNVEALKSSGVLLRMPVVDLAGGDPGFVNESGELWMKRAGSKTFGHEHTFASPINGAVASAAFPAGFPAIDAGRSLLSDGGIRDNAPLGYAIGKGCNRILVLLASSRCVERLEKKDLTKARRILPRVLEIGLNEGLINDLDRAREINWACNHMDPDALANYGKRSVEILVIEPSEHLGGTFDFSENSIASRLDLGFEDAKSFFFSHTLKLV